MPSTGWGGAATSALGVVCDAPPLQSRRQSDMQPHGKPEVGVPGNERGYFSGAQAIPVGKEDIARAAPVFPITSRGKRK